MFNNTGNLSFYLGIIFIAISFAGLILVYIAARRKLLEESSLEKIVDLGKWVIGSVAIILSGSIISDGFKEREQDIKELDFFDKYVSTVTQVEGIEQRWLLCQYFAAVSPEGPMKDGWVNYQALLDPVYNEYKENKTKIAELINKDSLDPKESKQLRALQSATIQLEQKLIATETVAEPTVYIHYGNREQKDLASQIRDHLRGAGYKTPATEFIQNYGILKDNEIRYFKESDVVTANAIQALLKSYGVESSVAWISWYSSKAAPGTVEVWIK